jgi:hypothetical protein
VLMLSIVESMCHTRYRVFLTILGEPLRRGIPHQLPEVEPAAGVGR